MLLARSNCIAMARSALVAASAISDWSGAAALLGAPKRVAISVLPVERRSSTLGPCGVTTFRHGTSHATPHQPPSRCPLATRPLSPHEPYRIYPNVRRATPFRSDLNRLV